jgi:CRISPR-associated protein Cas2
MFYIISYDIVDNRRRYRVARYLESVAVRVQKSVFEADWNQKILYTVIEKIKKVIDETEDSVRIYRLCSNCQSEIVNFGVVEIYKDEDLKII